MVVPHKREVCVMKTIGQSTKLPSEKGIPKATSSQTKQDPGGTAVTALGTLRVGTAGWTNKPSWRGPFFPPRTSTPNELDAYQHHLHTVEINGTCYSMPSEATVTNWKSQCGKGFLMSPKMVNTVTHNGSPDQPQALQALRVFADRIAILGRNLGPILLQFPRTLFLRPHHVDAMANVIAQSALSVDAKIAIEVRHQSAVHDKALIQSLRKHGWCLVVHPNSVGRSTVSAEHRNEAESSYSLEVLDTDWPRTASNWMYVRLHGTNDSHYGCYTDDQLIYQAVPSMVSWLKQGLDVYAYILNDDDAAAMPLNAQRLQDLCYTELKNIYPNLVIPRAPKQVASIASFFTPRKKVTTESRGSSVSKISPKKRSPPTTEKTLDKYFKLEDGSKGQV